MIRLTEQLPGTTPPTEFRIFPRGEFSTTKGNFVFDAASAKSVLAHWKEHGIGLSLDYEHASLEDAGQIASGAPAAGWYDLEVRDGELWAVNVRWTPRAAEYLKDREYRYYSPAFATDGKGHVTRLINVALTNLPATDDLPALVAAKAVPYASHPIVEGAWDGDVAVGRLRKWASSDGSGNRDTIDWRKYAQGFAYVGSEGDQLGDFKLPHHDVRDGKLVTVQRGVEAAAAVVNGARGGVDIPAAELPAVRRHLAQHYHQWGGRAPWESAPSEGDHKAKEGQMDETLKKLGDLAEKHEKLLKDHGDLMGKHEQLLKRHEKLMEGMEPDGDEGKGGKQKTSMQVPADVIALTGKATPGEAQGVLLAWRSAAEKLPTIEGELAKLKGEALEREVSGLVDTAVREGKAAPAQKSMLLEMGRKDLPMLKSFLEATPKLISTTEHVSAGGESTVVVLTDEDRRVARAMHLTDEEIAKAKAARKQ